MAVQIHYVLAAPPFRSAVIGWGWPFRYTEDKDRAKDQAAVIGWGWPFRYTPMPSCPPTWRL